MKMLFMLPAVFLMGSGNSLALGADIKCDEVEAAVEVEQGLFVRPGRHGHVFVDNNIANIGFIVGEKSVAVIDTGGSIAEGENLACQIKKATDLPVRFVINTHVHPDHNMGNSAFNSEGVIFIGHYKLPRAMGLLSKTYLRRAIEQSGKKISEQSIVLPTTTVDDELEIDLGNRLVRIMALPQAHTDNDLVVLDNKTRTLWLSDLLFHEHIPVIGNSGSVNGWLNVLEDLKNKSMMRVIPGHGPLTFVWSKSADNQIYYLVKLRDEIRAWIKKDGDLSKAMQNIGRNEANKWKMFSSFHKRNISYMFSELEWE